MRTTTRCAVLLALVTVAMLALMAVPQDGTSIAKWLGLLVASKAVFAVCAAVAWKLFARWAGKPGLLDKQTGKEE